MSSPNPFAWLGLLKWSLSYTDGTKPTENTEELSPLSEEDKRFLESVMKDGIIDENARMHEILNELTSMLEHELEEDKVNDVVEFLWELNDIVGQIDYARAFVAMGGLPFLLGCAKERENVNLEVRCTCLIVLATLAQNNPPVQNTLLDLNAVSSLTSLYFEEDNNCNGQTIRSKIVQAVSCIVRGHARAEEMFCNQDKSREMIQNGLGIFQDGSAATTSELPCLALRKRCIFFLRALICSDYSTRERIQKFTSCISKIIITYLDSNIENDLDVRENAISALMGLLEQKKSVNAILDQKDFIIQIGAARREQIKAMADNEEKDMAMVELDLWEMLIRELSLTQRDEVRVSSVSSNPPFMISGRPHDDSGESLPQ